MASFTDSISTYNPYISELPVDLMTKVGMAKQQQYEQGIQKIQSTIDNVVGLDIYRDNDKQYLQSKLNQLGNDLKWVGASDFSDFQLVNSVNGMTNQLAKDPNVLNAVSSTARVRKGFADMESAKKAGKSSATNDWIFAQSVNEYANNKDLKASYSGGYEQYVDIDKELIERLKAAHADKLAQDENIISYDKTGKAIINHDLLSHHIKEGLSTSKVMSIARSVYSDPKNARQLQIDGLYNYRGYDADSLLKDKRAALDYKKEMIFNQTPYLRAYSLLGSGDKKIQADKNLLTNYEALNSLDKEYTDFESLVNKDLDSAKFSSYFDSKLQEVSKEYAWSSDEYETKVNPQFDVNMKKSEFALKQAEFAEKQTMDQWEIKKTQAEIAHMANEDMISQMKLDGKLDAEGNTIWTAGASAISPEEIEKLGPNSFYTDLNKDVTNRNQMFANITSGIGIDYNGKHYTDFYIKDTATKEYRINPKYLNKDPNSKYILNDIGGKLYETAKAQMKSKIDAAGQLHLSGKVDKAYAEDIKNWWDAGTVIAAKKQAANEVEQEFKPVLDKIKKTTGLEDSYVITKGSTDLSHSTPTTYSKISKEQLMDIALYRNGSHIFTKDDDVATQAYARLKSAFGDKTDEIVDHVRLNIGGRNSKVYNAYNAIKDQLKSTESTEALTKRANKFKDMQRQSNKQEITLTSAKPEIRESMRLGLMKELETIMGDKSSGRYKEAAALLEKVKNDTGIDNNSYSFKYDDKTGKWFARVTQLGGAEFAQGGGEIEVGPGFVQTYKLGNMLNPKELQFSNSTIGKVLNIRAGYSTVSSTANDLNSPKAYATAIDRSNIGNYSVGYHVIAKDQNNDSYIPYLYIRDAAGKVYSKVPMDWSKLSKYPGLSKDQVRALESYPIVYDRLKLEENIEAFKSNIKALPDPDKAIQLLISNYDNN